MLHLLSKPPGCIEQARVAGVINLIGDISHDVKNLLTPAISGVQTLELIIENSFKDVDTAVREAQTKEELAERVERALQDVRSFYPEAIEITADGAQAVQDRIREIDIAIKGIATAPNFELGIDQQDR